jgi:hypothetical protein
MGSHWLFSNADVQLINIALMVWLIVVEITWCPQKACNCNQIWIMFPGMKFDTQWISVSWSSMSIIGLTFILWVTRAWRIMIKNTSASLGSRSTLRHPHQAMPMHYVQYTHHCALVFDLKMRGNGPQFWKLDMWKGPMSKCPVED